MKYTLTMTRTYVTIVEVDATSIDDALKNLPDLYEKELEQCNVTDENVTISGGELMVDGQRFARKCDMTGEGMDDGWVFGGGELYAKYESAALFFAKRLGYSSIDEAYNDDACYWTEWEEENDYQYIVIDGKLEEIE